MTSSGAKGWGRLFLVPVIASIVAVPALIACSSEDDEPDKPAFKSFEPAANDPSFSQPRDAVPLDNGGFAFLARANGTNAGPGDDAAQEGDLAQINDRYALFVVDAPNTPPRIVIKDLIAPFNLATDGKDKLYVADIGGGPDGQGALLEVSIAAGSSNALASGYQPQGVTVDKNGKVYFTGKDKTTGAPGVFSLDGPTAISTDAQLRSPSGIEVADDGTIYVADPAAGMFVEDDTVMHGAGHGVIFKIKDGATTLLAGGYEGGYPTGIALSPDGKLVVSAYANRGAQSAVLIYDPANPGSPRVVTDKLQDTFVSAGLHRSLTTGNMAWSGGDTVYMIQP